MAAARVALITAGAITFTEPDSGGTPATPGALLGLLLQESAGAAASVQLFDGASGSAPQLTPVIKLAANQFLPISFEDNSIEINSGKVFSVITGAIVGSEILW